MTWQETIKLAAVEMVPGMLMIDEEGDRHRVLSRHGDVHDTKWNVRWYPVPDENPLYPDLEDLATRLLVLSQIGHSSGVLAGDDNVECLALWARAALGDKL